MPDYTILGVDEAAEKVRSIVHERLIALLEPQMTSSTSTGAW
jgi:hypothetical protein